MDEVGSRGMTQLLSSVSSTRAARVQHENSVGEAWIGRYRQVRALTQELAAPLVPEDQVIQSMPDVSPTKWHLAHTTWFFETFILKELIPAYRPAAPEYAYLFNSYYNAAGPQHCRARRGVISRPTVAQTHAYRQQVDEAMIQWLESADESSLARVAPVLELGLNHEQQHQELLLTDVKHVLGENPLHPVYRARPAADTGRTLPLAWVEFGEGLHLIGHAGERFAYDNEGPRHRTFVEAFQLASRPVSNGEYLQFMEEGGYERAELWLSLGWQTVQAQLWNAPLYWQKHEGAWHHFTLAGLRPLHPAEPVCHLSYFEADAYARWVGARLPTEQEWEVASQDQAVEGNCVESGLLHPQPAARPKGSPPLLQLFGDVWEWTRSAYSPYPGYQPAAGALGEYNGKFMCNQYVLRGGSCATSASHLRRTYRNFFAPEKRWQFTGLRLAKDIR
jgi:ergothioneine biosynthesis protein EgtB